MLLDLHSKEIASFLAMTRGERSINAITQIKKINGQLRQQIRYLRVFPLKIPPEIKHNTGEEVNYQRKADSKK